MRGSCCCSDPVKVCGPAHVRDHPKAAISRWPPPVEVPALAH